MKRMRVADRNLREKIITKRRCRNKNEKKIKVKGELRHEISGDSGHSLREKKERKRRAECVKIKRRVNIMKQNARRQ